MRYILGNWKHIITLFHLHQIIYNFVTLSKVIYPYVYISDVNVVTSLFRAF
jgi:hypothetical protein